MSQVIKLTERNDAQELQAALYRERKDVAKRISRYQEAIGAGGGDIAAVVAKLRELEARQRAIDVELRGVLPVPRPAAALIENRLAEWRRLLRQSTTQGRAVLQRVLRGRVTFTPSGEGYTFEAPTRSELSSLSRDGVLERKSLPIAPASRYPAGSHCGPRS